MSASIFCQFICPSLYLFAGFNTSICFRVRFSISLDVQQLFFVFVSHTLIGSFLVLFHLIFSFAVIIFLFNSQTNHTLPFPRITDSSNSFSHIHAFIQTSKHNRIRETRFKYQLNPIKGINNKHLHAYFHIYTVNHQRTKRYYHTMANTSPTATHAPSMPHHLSLWKTTSVCQY